MTRSRTTFDLSGVVVALDGLPAEAGARLLAQWSAFLADDRPPFLELAVRLATRPAPPSAFAPKRMRSALAATHARFEMPEGLAEVDARGRGRIELTRGLGTREFFTLLNLLRACLAWRLPDRGAAMLHAAGLVIDGRGFLLVGAEGAGKSTWARLGETVGAHVVSDDLVLVDPEADGYALLGAPFRSTHPVTYRPGRWPLAAILFPRHGTAPRLQPTPGLIARARLTANLTFVADAPAADGRIPRVVDRLARVVRCEELTFALDAGFVELLRGIDRPPDGRDPAGART
ncbi:MAG TPA: hypothetical protein VD788_16175 [Candidatus Polarisedimenticolaceae bacterium]|nr:hypothetical protein [Candidatus Polarisedimenticolaceae bacterium]